MTVQHFGEFLRRNKVVSKSDLGRILKTQDRQRLPIGEMAVAGGYMDYNDVQRVLKEQESSRELFGRISMDLGLLDSEKVDFLLRAQTQETKRIGELLVERNVISQDRLRTELKHFSDEQRRTRRRNVLIVGSGSEALQALKPLTRPMRLELLVETDLRRAVETAHRRHPELIVLALDPKADDLSLNEAVSVLSENWQTSNVPTLVMPVACDVPMSLALPGNMETIDYPFETMAVRQAIEGIDQGLLCDTASHILVIDFNPLSRALICQELIDAGMTVFRAESVTKAIEVIQAMEFDLAVIGDCPDASDAEALRNLRRLAGVPLLRVAPGTDDVEGLPVETFDGPFLPGELSRHIEGMLERIHLRRRKTIVVMSEAVSLREVLLGEFDQGGFNAVELSDAGELTEYVRRHHADLVLMDIGGLDEGAMNLVGRIRRQSDPFTTPIVVITDSQDPELAWRAFAAGAGDVVRKPLDSGEVAARVGRLLQAKMKIESLQAECRRLEKLSVTDPLTGLSNRRHFVQLAEQEVERSRRYNRKPVAVVMIDIDDFKHFNDTYGHRHGDLILREIAQILRTRTRITDIVSRFGGEEFAIALPETNLDGALVVAENLRRAVEKAEFFGREYKELVTISVGVSAFDPRQGGDIDAAILRADKAMYRAKEAGKNRTEVDETVRKAS